MKAKFGSLHRGQFIFLTKEQDGQMYKKHLNNTILDIRGHTVMSISDDTDVFTPSGKNVEEIKQLFKDKGW